MVLITIELVRKRAEHHDGEMAPLEEISLHQENIERLEHLQHWCPKLKILLLQSNLIPRIENLNRLKDLSYLNLAINNIELIENLDGCESLNKLDLTLNFIGDIESVESLTGNYNLQTLYLTGNPCTDYANYRQFVVATLPQLTALDGIDIEKSERIRALQELPRIRRSILADQHEYAHQRGQQKIRLARQMEERWKEYEPLDEEERNKRYWQETCEHAPEVRLEMEKYKDMKLRGLEDKKVEEKKDRRLFAPDGRPFNVNEPKVPFKFEELDDCLIVHVEIFKYLDTSLVDVDIQPRYVRVTLKGKILQLALPDEVKTSESTAKRSQTSGHLVLTMPRLKAVVSKSILIKSELDKKKSKSTLEVEGCTLLNGQSRREYLEIGSGVEPALDLTNILRTHSQVKYVDPRFLARGPKPPSKDFVDNPDVPALE